VGLLTYLRPSIMMSAVLRAVRRRSPRWPAVERAHLRREPVCQWCGGREHLQVHHVEPWHLAPARELDPTNLITLCMAGTMRCHYVRGHRGTSWLDFDPEIRAKCDARRRAGG
jgi:5-methylcytosine-specific restriction enzyme A